MISARHWLARQAKQVQLYGVPKIPRPVSESLEHGNKPGENNAKIHAPTLRKSTAEHSVLEQRC